MTKSATFWVTVLVAIVLTTSLYFLSRVATKRFRFSKRDIKAAGLNRKKARAFVANRRKKYRPKKMRF